MSIEMTPGRILQTIGKTDDGRPDVIMLVLTPDIGVSLQGGGLAPGNRLSFGGIAPFVPEQWEDGPSRESLTEVYGGLPRLNFSVSYYTKASSKFNKGEK